MTDEFRIGPLRRLIRETRGFHDLGDALSSLTPEEWRAIVIAVGERRCLACGRDDGCECDARTDEASTIVRERAEHLG